METLRLPDRAFVDERYHAIEAERQRRALAQRPAPAAVDGAAAASAAVWPLSSAEKEIVVMGDILADLSDQIRYAVECQATETVIPSEAPSSPTKDAVAAKKTLWPTRGAADAAATPPDLEELPVATQLALKMFFRVCASVRSAGTADARLLAMVAAKVPAMLAKLPSMALSAGVANAPSFSGSSTADGCGSDPSAPRSVLEELLEIFGALLEPAPPRQSEAETATPSLSESERADVLMAYVAVALKWGRLRDLAHVMLLLIERPGALASSHIEQLAALVAELTAAEAIAPARQLLPEESSASGYLVSFGKGDHGKLGHGQCTHASCAEGNCTENKTVPTVIASTRDTRFVKIDSLSTHSIAVTAKGEVMAWGNGDKYRLGHGNATKEYAPRIIDSLSLKGKVSDVACGLGHTLALMANGDIYAWGNGSNGRLGLGDTNDRSSPTKLVISLDSSGRGSASTGAQTSGGTSSSAVFRYVICGASHSLAVTSDGRAFAWGKNNQGQCGHGHTNDQLTAIEVRHFREELNEQTAWAAGGWEHTLFCSTSGRVYSCGCGYKDSRRAGIPPVLGHGDCEKRLKPTVIQTFLDANEEMVRVSCGWDHSLAVSAHGAMYTWGSGTNGKLGHGDEENCEVPTLVRSLAGKFVKDAKAGCEHTVALTDAHELWTFGQGDSGRLGLGDTTTRKVPTMVEFFTHSGLYPVAIAVGDKYNLILADDTSGPANHQGALKSPGKSAPPSPTKIRAAPSDQHASAGRSRKTLHPPSSSLPTVKPVRDLCDILAINTDLDDTASPRDQEQLLRVIAVNIARIASGYMAGLWSREGMSVERLPYALDVGPLTLERLLAMIRTCQDAFSHPSPAGPPERALEMIVICLRVLIVNIGVWSQFTESGETNSAATPLLADVRATVRELAWKGVESHQQVLNTGHQVASLQALIQDEAGHVLRIGFATFYPTTADRTRLLSEIGTCEASSPGAVTLTAKLCEDAVAHGIVLRSFYPSAAHECVSIPRGAHEARGGTSAICRMMVELVDACTQDATRRVEMSVNVKSEAVTTQLRLLAVLQGHWFGVAAWRLSASSDQGNASICSCCVEGLSDYVCLLLDTGTATLERIAKTISRSEDGVITALDGSFMDSVVLQAVQGVCALLMPRTNDVSPLASRGHLSIAEKLLPGLRYVLKALDEISRKIDASNAGESTHNVGEDGLTVVEHSWVEKLGRASAMLCGQIANCFLSLYRLSHENQVSEETASNPSLRLEDGFNLITELLRQLGSPGLKCALLIKLSEAIKGLPSHREEAGHALRSAPPKALTELCIELTDIAGAEDLPVRARAVALTFWLWLLRDATQASVSLSDLVSQSGVGLVTGEILLHGGSSLVLGDAGLHRVAQHLLGPQRSQPLLTRLRPVEELVTTVPPQQALCRVALEVFSAAVKQLCSTSSPATAQRGPHPLLTPMQITETATAAPGDARRRNERVTHSMSETIKAMMDCLCRLLQRSVESSEKRRDVISPLPRSMGARCTADSLSCFPRAAFLLASPLSISSTRSQIVKPLRIPGVVSASQATEDGTIRAISLWFIVDAPSQVHKEGAQQPVAVLAALGEASDRLQEGASSAGSSTALALTTGDRLRAIVFLCSHLGEIRLGYASARDLGRQTIEDESLSPPVWESYVTDEPVRAGTWIHVSVSCTSQAQPAKIFVNGVQANCRLAAQCVIPTEANNGDLGKINPRIQLVAGGTLDDSFAETLGVSGFPEQDPSQTPSTSSPSIEVVVDDVWLFARDIDSDLAQRLTLQGQTIQLIKREHDADQHTLAVLRLLNETLTFWPLEATETDPGRATASSHLQDALFKFLRTSASEASFQIALSATEALKRILPAVLPPPPPRSVLEALMELTQRSAADAMAFDLCHEVSMLYALSTRAGVQSAPVAASQATVATLLRQAGVMNTALTTSGEHQDTARLSRYRHVLIASVVALVQVLSSAPAWQRHCVELLHAAAARLGDVTCAPGVLAAVTVAAGYSECFGNAQAVALASSRRYHNDIALSLEMPWTSAHRSPLTIEADAYAPAAWRFACDFHADMWNLQARDSARIVAGDSAVLARVRLQSLALRSLLSLHHSPSHATSTGDLTAEWKSRLLSDPETVEALLRAAVVRTRQVVRARLGPDANAASAMRSVQWLSDTLVARSSSGSGCGLSRLLLEEDLEVLAAELHARFESQPSQEDDEASTASTIYRQHYWRDPRVVRSPLEPLSGDVEIRGLAVRAVQHFPTVRLARVAITASSGLWYYQVRVLTDGLLQIGYVDTEFVSDAAQGQGVGDHANSWAFDGFRRKKWNVSSSDYGESWRAGDIVGVLLDTDRLELSFFLNGAFLGVAFSNLPLSPSSLLFPAISLNADQRVVFDFGARSVTPTTDVADGHEVFRLPLLGSPLDAQRLRPVALAMDESASIAQDSDEEEPAANVSDFDSNSEGADEREGDDPYSPLATPTTPPSQPRLQIYHPTTQLGSLHGDDKEYSEDNEPLVSGSLVSSIQATFGDLLPRAPRKDDADDSVERVTPNADREAELVDGLLALGFPQSWALRCARETAFTLDDSGAVSWILEQMEREAAASVVQSHEGLAEELSGGGALSTTAEVRRARDDSSVGIGGVGSPASAPGRRTWQLALSPSRDGRPRSEQFVRSGASLASSPQKLPVASQAGQAPRVPSDSRTDDTGDPFELSALVSEEEDDGGNDGEDSETHTRASAWLTASAAQQYYRTISSGSLQQRFARLDLRTTADGVASAKDDTPRRQVSRRDQRGGDEDLLPACLVAHSVLSLSYVRVLTETLLFGGQSDAAQAYPVVAQWASGDKPGAFAFLRRQLQLDARELPASCSRSSSLMDERRLQRNFARLLRVELLAGSVSNLPLHHAAVAEIQRHVADALRDAVRVQSRTSSVKTVLRRAMNARWTLWLASALRAVATQRGAICALLEPAFVRDVTRLAARATSVWRQAAIALLREVLRMDTATRTLLLPEIQSQPHSDAPLPAHLLVDALATLLRKDPSRRVAFAAPIATLWDMLLLYGDTALSPHVTSSATASDAYEDGTGSSQLVLRVEQVAPTHVTISWTCIESPSSTALGEGGGEGGDATASSEAPSIDTSVFSLSVFASSDECASIADTSLVAGGSPSKAASGVPHFLPSKGSLVLRHLAPDTDYTVRLTKSPSPLATATATDGTAVAPTPVATRDACVRTPREPVFELDPAAAGKHLVLSNRRRTVRNLVNKKWHTVRATVGFDEGVHRWLVRVDACVSKNIFIGVCTADASLENYVGSDAFGYGFLANKAVWHNKSKLHAYGEIFKHGDLLQVTLDCGARTLAFSRNGESMGIAATNLHVAAAAGSIGSDSATATTSAGVACKWFPAFSLYNKDDQLTLLVPPASMSTATRQGLPGLPPRALSQHASVLALVASARRVLAVTEAKGDSTSTLSSVYGEEAFGTWRRWLRGEVCWREVALGEIVEIDTRRDAVAELFGLAPGDAVFTSRGHCVVLGSHNHELWYEIVDALELGGSGSGSGSGSAPATLGSWSLSACRAMVSAPDEYPVHRVRRHVRRSVGLPEELTLDTEGHSHQHQVQEAQLLEENGETESETVASFHQTQAELARVPQLDKALVALVDAVTVHRGLRCAYQLSFADLASAMVLHDVVDTLRGAFPAHAPTLGSRHALLVRIAWLVYVNQHVYRVVRLFLSPEAAPSWEQSVCAALNVVPDASAGGDTDLEKARRDARAATARLAASVGVDSASSSSARRERLRFLRSHLFDSQREQLIAEALRRTTTPTLVGLGGAEPGGGDDGLPDEPEAMLRLRVRLPPEGSAVPFWQSPAGPSPGPESTPSWMLPASERRATTVFAQLAAQLAAVDPAECRRQYIAPAHADSVSISRTFQLAFLEPSTSTSNSDAAAAAAEPVVLAEHASQYLKFWDELFTEIQSPRFPLFVPEGAGSDPLELDVNARLLLPECAVRCGGLDTDEVRAWFFLLGQLLGMIWRAGAVVPMQFVSPSFWLRLVEDEDDENDSSLPLVSEADRLHRARSQALRAIREGLCAIVPHECLQLSSPASLRSRLSDTDVFQLDRLQRHAVYDRDAPHHVAFWATAHGLSSLERLALVRFLGGKASPSSSRWVSSTITVNGDDAVETWKRQQVAAASPEEDLPSLFQLELTDALADAHDHPDACFPVVHAVDAQRSRLHLPVYSSASVLRQKLLLAMSTALPATL